MKKIEFVGAKGIVKYEGDGILCRLDHPDTCIIEVSEAKAEQLLSDFPLYFKIIRDEFLESLKNPKKITKDMINDYAAEHFPELKITNRLRKDQMIKKLLEAA